QKLGYKKLIATPHIMGDFYFNTPEIIHAKAAELREKLSEKGIDMQIGAAAEYYLDEFFDQQLKSDNLLTFGDNYVLVETSYITPTNQFDDFIFKLQTGGYKPVLAHPERYLSMHNNWSQYDSLFDKGVLFQINISSLTGYYSPEVRLVAERLIKEGKVHFFGSDLHHTRHLKPVASGLASAAFKGIKETKLLNPSLLEVQ
ncbi:MAG: capsular biosynthesis protein, partial [Bacteroidota bacterium]|nr:capsular biosynthesis protein [Bacteroidota bacterium]